MPEVSTKGEIAAVINQLAAKLCLERFGTIGDVVVFQPLQHFLEHQEGSPPRSVRIKESGIRAIRPDQSSRVLLRAIVSKT
jgi:hypothetical protein